MFRVADTNLESLAIDPNLNLVLGWVAEDLDDKGRAVQGNVVYLHQATLPRPHGCNWRHRLKSPHGV